MKKDFTFNQWVSVTLGLIFATGMGFFFGHTTNQDLDYDIHYNLTLIENTYESECSDVQFMQGLVDRFAESHVYINKTVAEENNVSIYTCENYSDDLYRVLFHLGIDEHSILVEQEGNHQLNRVCYNVEPQTGEITEPRAVPSIVKNVTEPPVYIELSGTKWIQYSLKRLTGQW